jgi:hypothetical protein
MYSDFVVSVGYIVGAVVLYFGFCLFLDLAEYLILGPVA